MSDQEFRDYAAVQAMSAMLNGDSMAPSNAITCIEDPGDSSAGEWMMELTHGAFEIADAMVAVRSFRNNPSYQEQRLQKQATLAADRQAEEEAS